MNDTSFDRSERGGAPGWSPGLGAAGQQAGRGSLIGPTVVIRGELAAEEDLVIRGRVEGSIDHDQTLTIHAEGVVRAEVKAQEVLVEGTVEGNVYGTQRVRIAATANVSGNLYSPRVGVMEGASFKGCVDMDPDAESIDRRFRENSGLPARAGGGSAAVATAAGGAASSASPTPSETSTGEHHVAQASEQGQPGLESDSTAADPDDE